MKKGFIYRFANPNGRHPFVFIENKDFESFIGCMITSAKHSNTFPENILMAEEHFKTHNADAIPKEYEIKFKQSNLVRLYLIKRTDEVSMPEVGELTAEGILFLEEEIKNKDYTYWTNK